MRTDGGGSRPDNYFRTGSKVVPFNSRAYAEVAAAWDAVAGFDGNHLDVSVNRPFPSPRLGMRTPWVGCHIVGLPTRHRRANKQRPKPEAAKVDALIWAAWNAVGETARVTV